MEVIKPNIVSDTYVRTRQYYSLPQPTTTYSGITVEWFGVDSMLSNGSSRVQRQTPSAS